MGLIVGSSSEWMPSRDKGVAWVDCRRRQHSSCVSVSGPIDSAAPQMSGSDEKTKQTRERRRLRVAEDDSDGEQNYTAGGPVGGRMGRDRGKAVEEDGADSKWEEGAADSGIRGLMSNDGGRGRTGWQRAAGTPIPCQRVHASHGRRRKRSQQLESAPLDWPPSKRAERGPGSKQHGSPRKGCH